MDKEDVAFLSLIFHFIYAYVYIYVYFIYIYKWNIRKKQILPFATI